MKRDSLWITGGQELVRSAGSPMPSTPSLAPSYIEAVSPTDRREHGSKMLLLGCVQDVGSQEAAMNHVNRADDYIQADSGGIQ